MQLSIIIINYNTFNLTCKCLESIYLHIKTIAFEVILVDNASKEGKIDNFLILFPNIKLIRCETNLGFAGGNNRGLESAKGDCILLLNSDTELIESGIEGILDHFSRNQKLGAITWKTLYPDGRIQHVCNRFPSIKYELIELFRLQKLDASGQWLLGSFFDHLTPAQPDWVWASSLLTKRNVLNLFPHKKLHDQFFMYFEDVVWCYYIKKELGLDILYDPGYKMIHHVSASSGTEQISQKHVMITKNERAFILSKKGRIYTFIYYLIKGLKHLSLLKKVHSRLGLFYLKASISFKAD